ncbi:MAG: LptF/LptG family permease, partial [Bdellovibrionota bacterium]
IATTTYQKINFGSYSLYLEIPEGVDTSVEKPQMIPQKDLIKKIAETDIKSWHGREYRGEFWRRYSVALSPIIFAFLGIGFGTVRTRSVRASAVLIALVTLIAYWGIQTFGIVYGVQWGKFHAFWALQLPNIVLGIAAYGIFQRARW